MDHHWLPYVLVLALIGTLEGVILLKLSKRWPNALCLYTPVVILSMIIFIIVIRPWEWPGTPA